MDALDSEKPGTGPGITAIERPVHAGSGRIRPLAPRHLADPHPHDVGVGLIDRDRGDGGHGLIVEHGTPCLASVDRLPDPTGRGPDKNHIGIRHDRVDRRDPPGVAGRANASCGHSREPVGAHLSQGRLGDRIYEYE